MCWQQAYDPHYETYYYYRRATQASASGRSALLEDFDSIWDLATDSSLQL